MRVEMSFWPFTGRAQCDEAETSINSEDRD